MLSQSGQVGKQFPAVGRIQISSRRSIERSNSFVAITAVGEQPAKAGQIFVEGDLRGVGNGIVALSQMRPGGTFEKIGRGRLAQCGRGLEIDRKSTRLNSS